jgi:SAM-dependent MidA family methyltransferase
MKGLKLWEWSRRHRHRRQVLKGPEGQVVCAPEFFDAVPFENAIKREVCLSIILDLMKPGFAKL